jgi:antitoxin (DNA-binding transcriptional repressor) of toxin-antitoxin stability system
LNGAANWTKQRFKQEGASIMQTISVPEAKRRFSWLLTAVSQGEAFTITRRGKAIAIMRPTIISTYPDAEKAINELLTWSDRPTLDGLSIREMIEEGRA